jgi:hypothetical protein
MKRITIIGALALSAPGCTAISTSAGLPPVYTYNGFTCTQLQEEAALLSAEAGAAIGIPTRGAPRANPSAVLAVSWPDRAVASLPGGAGLKARMAAVERASRAKSCAIRFERAEGAVR